MVCVMIFIFIQNCIILVIELNLHCNILGRIFPVAGEEVVTALGSEVDRLEKEIQELVPGIRHVDIEAHNPIDLSP